MSHNFAALILTHGRPDRVHTMETLKECGYTGKTYIIIDNQDKTRKQYLDRFGDSVIIFDKKKIAKTFDQGDNFNDMRAIIYARNASFEIAKQLGLDYFIQLDDDYTDFRYRFDNNFSYLVHTPTIKSLDFVFDSLIEFLKSTPTDAIALAQGGDFVGGSLGRFAQAPTLRRKCMNSFICKTSKPFKFIGRINEDVNTYTRSASTGLLFFTSTQVDLAQMRTQSNAGGMTETYLDSGTYVKSFYSVMYHPSSVKVRYNLNRLHHAISWAKTVPCILREDLKKHG